MFIIAYVGVGLLQQRRDLGTALLLRDLERGLALLVPLGRVFVLLLYRLSQALGLGRLESTYKFPHKIWFLLWEQFAGFATEFNEFGYDFCVPRRACQTGSLATIKIVITRHFK